MLSCNLKKKQFWISAFFQFLPIKSPEVIWSTTNRYVPHIAVGYQCISNVFKIRSRTGTSRIDPFNRLRISPARNPCFHPRRIVCRSRIVVVYQLNVVDPTVDYDRNKKFEIQPNVEPIGFRSADVMNHVWFVEFSVELASSVTGNWNGDVVVKKIFYFLDESWSIEEPWRIMWIENWNRRSSLNWV